MRKRTLLVSAVALVAVLVAGGLFASNMGFKLNYQLERVGAATPADGLSGSGTQWVSLPYNQQTNLLNANDLLLDVGGTAVVAQIANYLPAGDIPSAYTGLSGQPGGFPLQPGAAYYVKLTPTGPATVSYIVVGSHNPGLGINLQARQLGPPLVSSSGTNLWSYPYHSTSANAAALIGEINTFSGAGTVAQIARYEQHGDFPFSYTGQTGQPGGFPLVPGDGYFIKVNDGRTVTGWVPSHY